MIILLPFKFTTYYDLASNPYMRGFEKLAGNKGYRIRVDKVSKTVTVIKVKHRREVYR